MVQLVFLTFEGKRVELEVPARGSIMQAAKANSVPGIDADCGGCMACGTCHVVVEESWYARLAPPAASEQEILQYVREPEANMRLTCQIPVTEAISGIVMRVPQFQH